jgi:hypothetical protein
MFPLLPAVLLLVVPTSEPDPTKTPRPPEIKFQGISRNGGMLFSVTNPNAVALPYRGYQANSFTPPLEDGTIFPLYHMELSTAGMRKSADPGWCKSGVGPVSIPPKGTVTFEASIPQGEWDEVKIGFDCYPSHEQKGPTVTVWSGAVKKDLVPKKVP